MADLNIRNVEELDMRQWRLLAMQEGVTLRAWVIARLNGERPEIASVGVVGEKEAVMVVGETRRAGRGKSPRKAAVLDEDMPVAREIGRKDVGHGGMCLCRECEAKRR